MEIFTPSLNPSSIWAWLSRARCGGISRADEYSPKKYRKSQGYLCSLTLSSGKWMLELEAYKQMKAIFEPHKYQFWKQVGSRA